MTPQRLVHHELCFGCGRTNLFGLLMDVERTGESSVRARGFIKQDHQGSVPGQGHEGVLLAALSEAMSFACGDHARAVRLELSVLATVPIGVFVDVLAEVLEASDGLCQVEASATVEHLPVARARGSYYRR